MPADSSESNQEREDVRSGTEKISQKAAELAEVTLRTGSQVESGRATTIHVGRDIYDAVVTVKLTKRT